MITGQYQHLLIAHYYWGSYPCALYSTNIFNGLDAWEPSLQHTEAVLSFYVEVIKDLCKWDVSQRTRQELGWWTREENLKGVFSLVIPYLQCWKEYWKSVINHSYITEIIPNSNSLTLKQHFSDSTKSSQTLLRYVFTFQPLMFNAFSVAGLQSKGVLFLQILISI